MNMSMLHMCCSFYRIFLTKQTNTEHLRRLGAFAAELDLRFVAESAVSSRLARGPGGGVTGSSTWVPPKGPLDVLVYGGPMKCKHHDLR